VRSTSLLIARTMAVAAALVVWPVAAHADVQTAVAESLFQQGRGLLERGRVAEACAKFAESQRLEPAGGTLLNLALCHEQQGRLATAHAEFGEALAVATREQRSDRQQIARARLDAIAPRLPHLAIDAPDRGAEISIDGNPLPPSALGVPFAVDPGDHQVSAWEAGKESVSRTVHVAEGRTERVSLPALAPKRAASEVGAKQEEPAPGRAQKLAGIVTMVAGGVVLTGGLVFLALVNPVITALDSSDCAISTANSGSSGAASSGGNSYAACRDRLDSASSDRNQTALIAGGVGLATGLVGGVIFLTAPRGNGAPRTQVGFGPTSVRFTASF
jgi:hypothetical protein